MRANNSFARQLSRLPLAKEELVDRVAFALPHLGSERESRRQQDFVFTRPRFRDSPRVIFRRQLRAAFTERGIKCEQVPPGLTTKTTARRTPRLLQWQPVPE